MRGATRARATVTLLAVVAGCSPGAAKMEDKASANRATAGAFDTDRDTTYRRRMKDLQARSRLVPTDSLARLYAALVPTAEPARHALRQAIMCQYANLLATYGQAATSRAKDRTIDSLQRTGLDWKQTSTLVDDGPGPNIQVSERACGPLPVPYLPDSLEFEPKRTPR